MDEGEYEVPDRREDGVCETDFSAYCLNNDEKTGIKDSIINDHRWKVTNPRWEGNVFKATINFHPIDFNFITFKLDNENNGCPKCGHKGDWINLGLTCPEHGVFG